MTKPNLDPNSPLNIREHGSFRVLEKNPRNPNNPQGNAKRSWPCVCAAVPPHAPPFPLPPWPPSLRGASAPRRRCAAEPDCRGWARRRKVGKGRPSWESAQGGAFYLWVWNFDNQRKNKSLTILDKTKITFQGTNISLTYKAALLKMKMMILSDFPVSPGGICYLFGGNFWRSKKVQEPDHIACFFFVRCFFWGDFCARKP